MTGGRAPKAKGDEWERAVVAYLQAHGYPYAERAYGAGRPDDAGDVAGVPGVCIQCRNTKTLDLAAAVDDATRQARAGDYPVAIVKRRRRGTGDGYVVMTLETFTRLTS
jgi:hypothetical protein